jgi:hypothetical protein
MNYEEFKSKKLYDIGTRWQHYSDLLSIWEETAELMTQYSYLGKFDEAKQKTLNEAIQILRNTLDGMSEYHDLLVTIRRLVDWVPTDPSVIHGGRGTPLLKEDKYEDMG